MIAMAMRGPFVIVRFSFDVCLGIEEDITGRQGLNKATAPKETMSGSAFLCHTRMGKECFL